MAREVPELPLRIDDHGREVVVGFLDEVTQRGALARTRGALDQAAAREQLVEVEVERAVGGLAERDARPVGYGHPGAARLVRLRSTDIGCERAFALHATLCHEAVLQRPGGRKVRVASSEDAWIVEHRRAPSWRGRAVIRWSCWRRIAWRRAN